MRGTEQFRLAEEEGKLLRLPTGDGGALVFRNSPEAPAFVRIENQQGTEDHPQLHVRMEIHSGPVNEVADLNEQANIAGAGINIAQRVMDCGDAGHILLSKRVADDSSITLTGAGFCTRLANARVKHGGNRSHRLDSTRTEEPEQLGRPESDQGAAPAKSVAVLPFVNMSADKHDEVFERRDDRGLIERVGQGTTAARAGTDILFRFQGQSEADIFRKVGDSCA